MSHFPDRWPSPARKLLDGRYCRLEPLDPSTHGDELFEAVSGPQADRLHRWLPDAVPGTRSEFNDWLMSNATSTDPIFYAVIDKATGRVGGRQALMDISTAHGSAEIGHILWGSQIAGTRVATEAFFLLADYVFGLGYRRYQWRCNTRNEPSSRAAERFGYTSEGVFRKHMVVKGESRDTAWYSILDQEWVHLRASYERWLRPENFDGDGRQKARLDELR